MTIEYQSANSIRNKHLGLGRLNCQKHGREVAEHWDETQKAVQINVIWHIKKKKKKIEERNGLRGDKAQELD